MGTSFLVGILVGALLGVGLMASAANSVYKSPFRGTGGGPDQ